MSTLTSVDINLKRSSTRVHAPPGGQTSINLGGYEAAPAKAAAPVVEVPPPAPAPVEEVPPQVVTIASSSKGGNKVHQVGVVYVDGAGSEELVSAVRKSFADININKVVFMPVSSELLLPFSAQNLVGACEVVLATAILTNDAVGNNHGAISQSLIGSLTQVGLMSNACVIPGIVSQSSLLEAKAILPTLAKRWAELGAAGLAVKAGAVQASVVETATVPPPAPITPSVSSVDDLLAAFQHSLKERGASGIAGLARKFRIADDDNSGHLSLAEFQKMTSEHTMGWTPEQTKLVFDYFDKDKSGSIVFDEFIVGIRGKLNDRRRQLVLMAFEILDADKSGVIEINDIRSKYDASKHPDVIANKRTQDEVLREFLDTFDSKDKDGKVTFSEFCDYYSNVSSSIDLDDYFELMIRNAWHISGGEGWCANSSCRRVLVIHNDGRQTVEEVKNDLGIKADDKAAILANLAAQGINDVASIDTTGSVDSASSAPAVEAPAQPPSPSKRNPADFPAAGTVPQARVHRRIKGGESTIVLG